jgi:hypothetical protein
MSLSEAREIIKSHGFHTNPCSDWEDQDHLYCYSKERVRNQSYRPQFVVHFSKQSGVLELIGINSKTCCVLTCDPAVSHAA